MDTFFDRNRKDILQLCTVLSEEISTTFRIDKGDLNEFMTTFLHKSKERVQCEGLVVSKNNTPCTCMAVQNELYCGRHLYLKDQTSIIERDRCTGIMKRGKQCVNHASHDSPFCKKHMYQDNEAEDVVCSGTTAEGQQCTRLVNSPGETLCKTHLKKSIHLCVHYTLDTEGNENFVCERFSKPDGWCCTSHESMNKLYKQNFKARNAKEYLSHVSSGKRAEHPMLSERYPNVLKIYN